MNTDRSPGNMEAVPAGGAARRSGRGTPARRRSLYGPVAAIVPAHNEGVAILVTIASLLAALPRRDIYVFADACSDETVPLARSLLPMRNVINHRENVGKSRGVETTLNTHIYPRGYAYVTVIDADTTIRPDYVEAALATLAERQVACVAGRVEVRRAPVSLFALYRTCIYWFFQAIVKRLQSGINAVTIAPGTATVWRVDVLREMTFDHRMSTEDFSLTAQVHRRHLGKIKYAPGAVAVTEEPHTLQSYRRQSYRWSRAWWESVRRYRLGLAWLRLDGAAPRLSAVDVFTALFVIGMYGFWLRLLLLPILFFWHPGVGPGVLIPSAPVAVRNELLVQCAVLLAPFLIASVATRNVRIALFAPALIAIALLDMIISVQAFFSVARSLYRHGPGGSLASVWASPARAAR